ncbi:hypothetical protein LCL98_09735 [Rossellomorea aquimaris]|nr:hypothetical protein [Rossellomorea aquimaris]
MKDGTYPIGAFLIDNEGNIICTGKNRVYSILDPTCHTEMDVIRQARAILMNPKYNGKCIL